MNSLARLFFTVAAFLPVVTAWAQAAPGTAVPAAVPPATTAPATQPVPAARWTPAQIREAFEGADTDSNGELTRSEAQRLAIMPRSFEDTDTNRDGVIGLAEYQAAFR